MEFWDIVFRFITLLGTVITGILVVYMPFKLKRIELDQKKEATERELKHKDLADARDVELDKKLGVRLQVVISSQENQEILINELKSEVQETKSEVRETKCLIVNHISDSSLLENFSKVYWWQVNQITHFWNAEDDKYKILFDFWANSIDGLCSKYIENKTTNKEHEKSDKYGNFDAYNEFHPVEIMERMITEFESRADALIQDTINNITFSKWLDAKNLHGKSRAIANTLEVNGLTEKLFITKMKEYIYNFGTIYSNACTLWLRELKKK